MHKAVIIDDIPKAISTLIQDLSEYAPNVKVIGTAGSVVEGVKLLHKIKPDLVFLDIELGDGTGFDLLEMLSHPTFKVIFTTGSDAYAIKAFRFSAIDYLLKPIDPDELVAAIKKVESTHLKIHDQTAIFKSQYQNEGNTAKIALSTQDQIKISQIQHINYCKSDGNYTTFHFTDDKALMVSGSIKLFEELLANHGFFRTHQSYLVNLNCIRAYIKTEGGYIEMLDGARIPVSVRKKPILIEQLKNQPL